MTTKLKCNAVKPLEGGGSDWSNEDAIVTFTTIDRHIMDVFELDCSWYETKDGETVKDLEPGELLKRETERKIDVSKFDKSKLKEPGVYKDDDGERCYTIILPHEFFTEKLLLEYIKKLNEKFDEDFELYADCIYCGEEVKLGESFSPKHTESLDSHAKMDMVFCSKECYGLMGD